MWDLISDPTARNQRKGVKKQQDVTTEEGFVQEVNVRMGQFGRAGGKRLQEVKKNLSAEQWQDVLATVFEVGHRFDVWTTRDSKAILPQKVAVEMSDYLRNIIRERASAIGRRSYIAGRQYAWRIAKEAEAEAVAEGRRKGKERRDETRKRNAKAAEELKASRQRLAQKQAVVRGGHHDEATHPATWMDVGEKLVRSEPLLTDSARANAGASRGGAW
mgnify:FL=1